MINLNNPIFVFYLDINGKTAQRAQEDILRISKNLEDVGLKEMTMIIPHNGDNKIDLLWKGTDVEKKDSEIKKLEKKCSILVKYINDPIKLKAEFRKETLIEILDSCE